MKMIIQPYIGVGNVLFGSTRNEVQKALYPAQATPFNRSREEQNTSDFYKSIGVFVYYNDQEKCEAIEFGDKMELEFEAFKIFKHSYIETERFFAQYDSELDLDDSGFSSYKLGIGIYAPKCREDENCKIEGLIVFKEGYYDDVT
jgi:hypothetical protein